MARLYAVSINNSYQRLIKEKKPISFVYSCNQTSKLTSCIRIQGRFSKRHNSQRLHMVQPLARLRPLVQRLTLYLTSISTATQQAVALYRLSSVPNNLLKIRRLLGDEISRNARLNIGCCCGAWKAGERTVVASGYLAIGSEQMVEVLIGFT